MHDEYILQISFYSPDDQQFYQIIHPEAFWERFETLDEWASDDEYSSWVEPRERTCTLALRFDNPSIVHPYVLEA